MAREHPVVTVRRQFGNVRVEIRTADLQCGARREHQLARRHAHSVPVVVAPPNRVAEFQPAGLAGGKRRRLARESEIEDQEDLAGRLHVLAAGDQDYEDQFLAVEIRPVRRRLRDDLHPVDQRTRRSPGSGLVGPPSPSSHAESAMSRSAAATAATDPATPLLTAAAPSAPPRPPASRLRDPAG